MCRGVAWLVWAWLPLMSRSMRMDDQGRIPMGVSSCDDAKNYLYVDWDNTTTEGRAAYTCDPQEGMRITPGYDFRVECLNNDELGKGRFGMDHVCMNEHITYTDIPPRAGPHRPAWPRYGEYEYCPPQRWLHSIEHGAAVFLYHPCAPPEEVNWFKWIAKSCLHRHIITPYRELPVDTNFAIVTYGCRLMLPEVTPGITDMAMLYLREHAITGAPEADVSQDGQYDLGLTDPGMPETKNTKTQYEDPLVCPMLRQDGQNSLRNP